ncbi:hypothetical protein SAMN04488558_10526 [Ignavigranum ruoffiae]|uniref:Uncharacterized protein n=1 Tax=Ignavigranum ruoffiae TaxID=89093 RepID=A0A1H9D4X8_9LACT|nr:hypothetical protein [Ignavigranum ruoffiae]SEQ08429.1 hypothetical protein SAMN04488558_10526 [Ignavigranum ruoffiae]
MANNMNKISRDRARMLAEQYKNDPEMKYVVYNIRRRSYILHNPYQYYFRFSRRESVWNTRTLKLENLISSDQPVEDIATALYNEVNQIVEDTVNFKLKGSFEEENCATLLNYYFNGKCNLAYYDYYLGRVCLIKERDKSDDFSALIGSRYYFIDDLHNVIQYKLGLSAEFLKNFLKGVMKEDKMIADIDGYDQLKKAMLQFINQEIEQIEEWLASNQLKGNKRR